MNNIRLYLCNYLARTLRQCGNQRKLVHEGYRADTATQFGRAIEDKVVNFLDFCGNLALLRARQMECLPAQRTLVLEDGSRPERIPAVQGDGMVEDMQDTHVYFGVDAKHWRANDSYISRDHIGVLKSRSPL